MSRSGAALGALSLAVFALAVAFLWQPVLDSIYDDSVSYLIMAQRFSPFHAVDPVIVAAAPFEKYPPLFPLLLAVSGAAYDWRIAHGVVAACFAASVFLLGRHAWRITGSATLGFLAALVFAAMPGAWLNAKGILSEFLYMALTFATLAYHERLKDAVVTRRAALALGALLAAALLTRTIGVALLAAVVLAEAMRFRRTRDGARLRTLAWAPAVALAAAAAWYLLRPAGGHDEYLRSSAVMLAGASDHGLAWALGWIELNAWSLCNAWLNALLIYWGDPWKPGYLLALALGVAGLVGAGWRAWRGHADGLYCALFLGILLFWPYPGQMYRLAFPVVPLLMVQAFWAAREALGLRIDGRRAERGAAYGAILPLALCVPAVLFYIVERARMGEAPGALHDRTHIAEFYRIPSGPAAEANARTQIAVLEDMARLRELTPEGARIMWYTPNYISLLARRVGVPLERPENPDAMRVQLRATGADYLYLSNVHPRDSLVRLGDPLFPALLARGFAETVWHRSDRTGRVAAVLMKVDKDKISQPRPGPP
jgi:4-amino-4-deoxy-L-arabinose transferase-like glycosyltransferase